MSGNREIVPIERIEQVIHLVRGHKVILDADLAELYSVATKRLKEQVKRNKDRFPSDFMFVLTRQAVTDLRSQFATSRASWGGTRYPPMAFTEHGAMMVASILNTQRAIEVSVYDEPFEEKRGPGGSGRRVKARPPACSRQARTGKVAESFLSSP